MESFVWRQPCNLKNPDASESSSTVSSGFAQCETRFCTFILLFNRKSDAHLQFDDLFLRSDFT